MALGFRQELRVSGNAGMSAIGETAAVSQGSAHARRGA
jgi:hypothetical protein